jgi:3-oxoacyl-(acyl-carrier-protein) synthase
MSAPIAITGGQTVQPAGAALPMEDVAASLRERIARVERVSALSLLAAAGALDAARLDDRVPRERVGVVLGTAFGCFLTNAEYERRFAAGGVPAASPRLFAATVSNAAAGEVAIAFGLGGPGVTLTAGAASGTVALAHAAAALDPEQPHVDGSPVFAVLAGGADAVGPSLSAWIDAGGFVAGRPLSCAASLLVLEPLAAARRRGASIHGTVLGCAVAFEPAPLGPAAGAGLAAAITRAIERSGVPAADIDGIVSSGRPAFRGGEERALAAVFGERPAVTSPEAPDVLAAAGPRAVLDAITTQPAGRVTLVVDACTSGHVAAMVVRSGAAE